MAKSKFLKVLNIRNRQSKYSKLQVMKKATAIILAISLGLGTTAPTFTYAKEELTVTQKTAQNFLDRKFDELQVMDKSQLPSNINGHYTFLYEGDLPEGNALGEDLTQKVKDLIPNLDFTILSPTKDVDFYQVYVAVRADKYSYIDTRLFTISLVQVNDTNKEDYKKLNTLNLPATPFQVDSTIKVDQIKTEAQNYLDKYTDWKAKANEYGYDMNVVYKIYSRMEDRVEVTFTKQGTSEKTEIIKVIPINYVVKFKEEQVINTAKYYESSKSDTITSELENQVRKELKLTKDFLSYLDYNVAVQKIDNTTYQVVVSEVDGEVRSQVYSYTQIYDCSEFNFSSTQTVVFDEIPTDAEIEERLKSETPYQEIYAKIQAINHNIQVKNGVVYLTLGGETKANLGKVSTRVRPISERLFLSEDLKTTIVYSLKVDSTTAEFQDLIDEALESLQDIKDMTKNLLSKESVSYRVKEIKDEMITVEVVLHNTDSASDYVLGEVTVEAKLFVDIASIQSFLNNYVIEITSGEVTESDIQELTSALNQEFPQLQKSIYSISFELKEVEGKQKIYYTIEDSSTNTKMEPTEIKITFTSTDDENQSKPGDSIEDNNGSTNTPVQPPTNNEGSAGDSSTDKDGTTGDDLAQNFLDREFDDLQLMDKSQLPTNINGHYTFLHEGELPEGNAIGKYLTTKVKELIPNLDFTILSPTKDVDFYQVYVAVRADKYSYIDTRLFTIQLVQVNETNKEDYEKLNALTLPAEPFQVDSTIKVDEIKVAAEKYLEENTDWKAKASEYGYDMNIVFKIYSRMEDRVEVIFTKQGTNEKTEIIKVIPINYVLQFKEEQVVDTAKYYELFKSDTIKNELEEMVRKELKLTKDFLSYLDYNLAVYKTGNTTYQVVVTEVDGGTRSQLYSFTQIFDCSEFDFSSTKTMVFDEIPTDEGIEEVLKSQNPYQEIYSKIQAINHDIQVKNGVVYLTQGEEPKANLGKISTRVRPISERLFLSEDLKTTIDYSLKVNSTTAEYQDLIDEALESLQDIKDMKKNLLSKESVSYRVKEVKDEMITVEVVLHNTDSTSDYVLGEVMVEAKLFVDLASMQSFLNNYVIEKTSGEITESDIQELTNALNQEFPQLQKSIYTVSFELTEVEGKQKLYYIIEDSSTNTKTEPVEIEIKFTSTDVEDQSKPGDSTEDKNSSTEDKEESDNGTTNPPVVQPPANNGGNTGDSSTDKDETPGDSSEDSSTEEDESTEDTVDPEPTPPADEDNFDDSNVDTETDSDQVTETEKEISYEVIGQVDEEGNIQASYELSSDVLSKIVNEMKTLVLTDKLTGTQVELGSKAINMEKLASIYGEDMTILVDVIISSNNTFKIEVTAKGSLQEGKLESFQDQMKITFDKKASKASLAYNQEIAMQKVDGKLVHIPHKIDGNKVSVRTYNTGEIVLTNASIEFLDIANDKNKQSIENLGIRGIVKGVGNDLFVPNRELTRAEFATMVARALGLEPQGENTFTDVKQGWYYDSVIALTEQGLIKGVGNNKFQPTSYITGEEIAVIMHRIIELELGKVEINKELAGDVSGFSIYAQEAIASLRTVGISTEEIVKGKTFNRSQMAKLLADTLEKVNLM